MYFQNNVFLGTRHLRGGGPDPGPASVRYGTLAYLTLIVFPRAERDTSGIIPNLRTSPSVRRFARACYMVMTRFLPETIDLHAPHLHICL